jgi:hypothetical protein
MRCIPLICRLALPSAPVTFYVRVGRSPTGLRTHFPHGLCCRVARGTHINWCAETVGQRPLPNKTPSEGRPPVDTSAVIDGSVALTANCDQVMWRRRFGHLDMHSLHAQYAHGVATTRAVPGL